MTVRDVSGDDELSEGEISQSSHDLKTVTVAVSSSDISVVQIIVNFSFS